jgi:ribosome-binding factor A
MPRSRPGAAAASPSPRRLRAGEVIRRALIEVLAEGHLRDPDLAGTSITVAEVRLSQDMGHAFAFVMPLGGADGTAVLAALRRARSFLRGEVARRVELRHAPELHFELDRSFDEGARLETLLRSDPVRRDLG